MNNRLFRDTAVLFLIIGILDFLANKFYLYWTVWWFDIILHFISGGAVAMTVVLFLSYYIEIKWKRDILICCLAVITVGILWEIFEVYFGIVSVSSGFLYWADTLSDIVLDLLGTLIGAKYSFYVLNKYDR